MVLVVMLAPTAAFSIAMLFVAVAAGAFFLRKELSVEAFLELFLRRFTH